MIVWCDILVCESYAWGTYLAKWTPKWRQLELYLCSYGLINAHSSGYITMIYQGVIAWIGSYSCILGPLIWCLVVYVNFLPVIGVNIYSYLESTTLLVAAKLSDL